MWYKNLCLLRKSPKTWRGGRSTLALSLGMVLLAAFTGSATEPLVRLLPTSPLGHVGGLEAFEGRYITRQAWSVDGSDWTVMNTDSWHPEVGLYRTGEVLVYKDNFSPRQWSADGIEWTTIGDGLPAGLRFPIRGGLVWWQDRYLLFASQENPDDGSLTGKVFETTDLTTFTERATFPDFNAILSNGDILIGSSIYWRDPTYRSLDGGLTWEAITPPVENRSFLPSGVADGVFYFYAGEMAEPDYLFASTNGIDWVSVEMDPNESQQGFFLLGGRPALHRSSSGGGFLRIYEPGTLDPLEQIAMPPAEEWDLIAQNGEDLLAISIRGTIARRRAGSWEILHYGDTVGEGGAVGNGLIVHSGQRANYLSQDGSSWFTNTLEAGHPTVKGFADGVFLALDGNRILQSEDGQTWNLATSSELPSIHLEGATRFDGEILLRGWQSLWKIGADGYSWTQVVFSDAYLPDGIMGWGQDDAGILVATMSASNLAFWWSEDADTWTRFDPPFETYQWRIPDSVAVNGAFYLLVPSADGAHHIGRFQPDSGWDILEGSLPQEVMGFAGAAGQLFLQTGNFENRRIYAVDPDTGATELLYEVPRMQPYMQASAFRDGIVLMTREAVWGIGIDGGENPPTAQLVSGQADQTLLPGDLLLGQIVFDRAVSGAVVDYFDNGRLVFTSAGYSPTFAITLRGSGLHRIEARARLPDGTLVSTAALEVEVAQPVISEYEIPFAYYSAYDANSHALILSTGNGWRFSTDLLQWKALPSPTGSSGDTIFESRGIFFTDPRTEVPAFTFDHRTWLPIPEPMEELQSIFQSRSLGNWGPTRFYGLRIEDFTWLTSTDMEHWQAVDFPGATFATSTLLTATSADRVVAWGGGKFLWSEDGVDFRPAAISPSEEMQWLRYDGYEFAALANASVHLSRNGEQWTSLPVPPGTDIKWANGTFFRTNGTGLSRKFEYSCDGSNWRTLSLPQVSSSARLVQIGGRVGLLDGPRLHLFDEPIPEGPRVEFVSPKTNTLEPVWGSSIDFEIQVTGVNGTARVDLYRELDRIGTVSGEQAVFSVPVDWSGESLIWAQVTGDRRLWANSEPVAVSVQYPHSLELVETFTSTVNIQDLMVSNGRLVAVGTDGFIAYTEEDSSWTTAQVRVETTEGSTVPLDLFRIVPDPTGGYLIRGEQGLLVSTQNLRDDFVFLVPEFGETLSMIEGDEQGYFASLSDGTVFAEYADSSTNEWTAPDGIPYPVLGLTRERVWVVGSGSSNLWWRWRDGSNDWQALTVPQVYDFPVSDSGGGFLLYRSEAGIVAVNDETLAITQTNMMQGFLDSVEIVPGFAFMGSRDTQARFGLHFSTNLKDWSPLTYSGTTPSERGSCALFNGALWLAIENTLYRLERVPMDGHPPPTPVITLSPEGVELSWLTVMGFDYTLDHAPDFFDWETYFKRRGTGQAVEVTLPLNSNTEASRHFYRIRQKVTD